MTNLMPFMATLNKALLIPLAIMCIVVLCSPAIQITLSTKKNKYIGLIFPAVVLIFFLIIVILYQPGVILSLLMTIGAPGALVAFHIIIRKNMRY